MPKKSWFALWTLVFFVSAQPAGFSVQAETAQLSLKNVAVPESLGKIDERFEGNGGRWVVHIQDVHAHFGAQENIAAILDHLNRLYGIRKVAYEGGWDETSYPKTWAIPPSREKQLVLRQLMEDDIITGPAFAAMNADTPITLKGIEDPELYKKNRAIYIEFIQQKDLIQKQVKSFEDRLENEKTATFHPELLAFDHELIKFREDAKTADKFIPNLLKQAETAQIDLSTLDQVELLGRAVKLEKSVDKQKLAAETARLMESFKNSRLSFEELVRSGKIPADKLSLYPNAYKQSQLMKLQDGIVHSRLFEQIESAIDKIKQSLFVSDAERDLDNRFTRFMTAKKIILFQASPKELQDLKNYREALQTELNPALLKALKLGRRFYQLAKKRDAIFFDKLLSDPLLAKEDIAVVTGGFHTEGLSRHLREKGLAYVVITPQLGDQAPNEALYFKRLQARVHEKQTLSEINNRVSGEQDAAVAKAVEDFIHGRQRNLADLADAVEAPLAVAQSEGTSFMDLSDEEARDAVAAAVQSIQGGSEKLTLVTQAAGLSRLIEQNPDTVSLINLILANPNNTLAVLYKSYAELPDVISDAATARNLLAIADPDISRALTRQRRLKDMADEKKGKISVAVMAKDYANTKVLVLDESIAALLLFRELLLLGWKFSWQDPDTQKRIAELLHETLEKQGLISAAA